MKSKVDTIEFISRDAHRSRRWAPWRFGLAMVLAGIPWVLVGFVGARQGLDSPQPLLAAAALSVSLFGVPFFLNRPQSAGALGVGFLFTLSMALVVGAFVPVTEGFLEMGWGTVHSNVECFVFGGGVSVLSFAVGLVLLRLRGPMLDERGSLALSLGSVGAGILALFLHCPSGDVGHILIAHLGQAALFAPLCFAVLHLFTRFWIRSFRSRF